MHYTVVVNADGSNVYIKHAKKKCESMSGQQAGLCLACGAPFCPKPTDEINAEGLGNMSLAYIQRQVRISKDAMTKIEHPSFYSVQEGAHIIHETHHKIAVLIMARERDDVNLTNTDVVDRDGAFPFMLTPGSKRSTPLTARWGKPGGDVRIKLTRLLEMCTEIDIKEEWNDMTRDYSILVGCCKSCNSTMTMEYWFRYHLYADKEGNESNPERVLPDEPITIYQIEQTRNKRLDQFREWTSDDSNEWGTFPNHNTPQNKSMMAPAVAYYLHLCLPFEDDHEIHSEEKMQNKTLYVEMCWVVLEITCLMCEYWRGSGDKENKHGSSKKRNQSHKSQLGAIELYFGYFCW